MIQKLYSLFLNSYFLRIQFMPSVDWRSWFRIMAKINEGLEFGFVGQSQAGSDRKAQ